MPLTLVQLISEQTMPNLLPVLRLKPERLVHLVTPRTAARSQLVVEAARQAGLEPTVESMPLSSMPTIAETYQAIRRAIRESSSRQETPIVNFTGGTKLMSIGAYAAALNPEHKAMSMYTDTENAAFVDGRTKDGLAALLEDDFSFTPLRSALTVNTIAVANGCERVTAGRGWTPFLPLARHLCEHGADERAVWESLRGPSGMFAGSKEPRSPEQWFAVLDAEFHLPLPVAHLAAESGLVRASAPGVCRLPDTTRAELGALVEARARNEHLADYDRRRIAATDPLQQAVSFLSGGWWEVVVADAMERSGAFRDLRWSAQVGQRGGADLEEDILGVDGVRTVLVSCKRGGDKARLVPHLEELNSRAKRVGGNFTRCFLAILIPLKGRLGTPLRQRAKELHVRILTPHDLDRPETFAHPTP